MQKLKIKIYGNVQGVGFRYEAKFTADKLGIKGFARNESDGTVYIEAEGDEDKLREFLEWCRKGPSLASVAKIESEPGGDIRNFDGFDVR
jgi:acylphosphatase